MAIKKKKSEIRSTSTNTEQSSTVLKHRGCCSGRQRFVFLYLPQQQGLCLHSRHQDLCAAWAAPSLPHIPSLTLPQQITCFSHHIARDVLVSQRSRTRATHQVSSLPFSWENITSAPTMAADLIAPCLGVSPALRWQEPLQHFRSPKTESQNQKRHLTLLSPTCD